MLNTQPQARTIKPPTIHPSQMEIASLVFDEIEKRGIVMEHQILVPYFIGPSFTALKKQTETDLSSFLSQEEAIRFPAGYKDFVCNSSSLVIENNPFLEIFASKKDDPKYLFALFHDEFHWGVGFDSIINKFFQHLLKLSGDGFSQNLIIILVSATGELLTKLSTLSLPTVDWRQLRTGNMLKHPPTNYIGVEELDYCLIDYNTQPKITIVEAIVKEYSEGDYVKFFQKNPNQMIIVRLDVESSASSIYEAINKNYPQGVRNFELVLLTNNKTLHEQLHQHVAQNIIRLSDSISKVEDIQVKHLKDIPCVLLLVDRLRVGERIPHTTAIYDVRAKYPTKINTRSTFIQDVGRCAGHYFPNEIKPKVLVTKRAHEFFIKDKYSQLDTKLKRTDNMLNQHPEKDNEEDNFIPVYTKLASQIMILSAEPQIGKTGVMLHLLTLLQSPSRRVSLSLFELLNNQYTMIAVDELQNFYRQKPEEFKRYHSKRMKRNITHWKDADPNEMIASELSTLITTSSQHRRIADCGCGFGSIFLSLKRKLQKGEDLMQDEESENVVIYGFDLCDQFIQHEPFNTSDLTVCFEYQCCDFKDIRGEFDIMVYCLSMMKYDITAYIQNARSCLTKNGLLYIAATEHSKFPSNQMKDYGFQSLKEKMVTNVPNGHGCTTIYIYCFKKILKTNPSAAPLLIDVSMHFC